jgi:hypothetical protein
MGIETRPFRRGSKKPGRMRDFLDACLADFRPLDNFSGRTITLLFALVLDPQKILFLQYFCW